MLHVLSYLMLLNLPKSFNSVSLEGYVKKGRFNTSRFSWTVSLLDFGDDPDIFSGIDTCIHTAIHETVAYRLLSIRIRHWI